MISYTLGPVSPSLSPRSSGRYLSCSQKDVDIGRSTLYNQLHREPFRKASNLQTLIVVFLDALDECGTERERKGLLSILVSGRLSDLPSFAKFTITSHPDTDIPGRTAFNSMDDTD